MEEKQALEPAEACKVGWPSGTAAHTCYRNCLREMFDVCGEKKNGSGYAAHARLTDTIVGMATMVTMATLLVTMPADAAARNMETMTTTMIVTTPTRARRCCCMVTMDTMVTMVRMATMVMTMTTMNMVKTVSHPFHQAELPAAQPLTLRPPAVQPLTAGPPAAQTLQGDGGDRREGGAGL